MKSSLLCWNPYLKYIVYCVLLAVVAFGVVQKEQKSTEVNRNKKVAKLCKA